MCAPMTVPILKPQTPTVRPHPDPAASVVVTPPLSTPPLQPLKTPPTRNNPPPPTYSPPSSESVDGTSWCHKWAVAQVGSTEKCWCTTSGVQSNSLCGSTTRVWRKWGLAQVGCGGNMLVHKIWGKQLCGCTTLVWRKWWRTRGGGASDGASGGASWFGAGWFGGAGLAQVGLAQVTLK